MKNLVLVSLFFVFTASAFLVGCSKKDDEIAATTVTYNGYTYKTVVIGTQTWFAENLRTEKYNDGTSPTYITDNTLWVNTTVGAYCSYNNDANMKTTYGYLYNWYAVNTGKLCPAGWHVPSDTEWTQLIDYLGGELVAGDKMKSNIGWSLVMRTTNESGFSALAGGYRDTVGTFGAVGDVGVFWSSTQYDAAYAWERDLVYGHANAYRSNNGKTSGFSVRCLRD